MRWNAQYRGWNQKWNNPGWAALEVLVCAGYRLPPVPVQAWRFSLRWWVWGLCCRPLQSSCSRSTACPLARQTQSTSHQASHLSSATQRGSVSASHTHPHTQDLFTPLYTHIQFTLDLIVSLFFIFPFSSFLCQSHFPTLVSQTLERLAGNCGEASNWSFIFSCPFICPCVSHLLNSKQ